MKKIGIALLTVIASSCTGLIGNGFKISGEIDGLADGTKVFLEKQDTQTGITVPVDTVKIEKGKFVFEGKAEEPSIQGIHFENTKGGFPVIVEKGNISVIVKKDSIGKAKVSGTSNNDELAKYSKSMVGFQTKMIAFQNNNMQTMQEAQQKMDTVVMNKLNQGFMAIQKEVASYNEKYVKDNPKSYISLLVIEGLVSQMSNAAPMADKIIKMYDALDSDLKNSTQGKSIKTKIDQLTKFSESLKKKNKVGQLAPNFSAPNPEGKVISLKESLGKVTLVDFWASWCSPCRHESSNMVALYKEFHDKGLNIVSVSLDMPNGKKKWMDAIAKDHLTWTHVSNLKHWDEPIAKEYGIESIPTIFVLDAQGKIVAKDLLGAELKAKVAELLAK